MSRPRIALIVTSWFTDSHAEVLGVPLIEGYDWLGEHVDPRVEVVSVYLEQLGSPSRNKDDIGVDYCARVGIPLFPSPAEALGVGAPGVNVDGVVIIGEHGDWELNEWGQRLYPRRRLFDACLSAMISADRFVPIFNDKHLAWNFVDAHAMYDNAQRLGVPLHAGSTIPLTWRRPRGTEWPMDEPMTSVVGAGYGGFEPYGYHALEGIQAFAERRAGGETGVAEVRGYEGDTVAEAVTRIDPLVLRAAIAAHGLSESQVESAVAAITQVITVTYRDGLHAAMVLSPDLESFAVAAAGPQTSAAAEMHLQPHPYSHFVFLARAVETLMLTGKPAYPVERTLLTGGILDHALRNAAGAVGPETPHLDISYTVPPVIADTGVRLAEYEHGERI